MHQDNMRGNLSELTEDAVAHYWRTRNSQRDRQSLKGPTDQGLRGEVTGGAQMDGFIHLLRTVVTKAGIPDECIFSRNHLELPGFFRPNKKWDFVVVRDEKLLAAIETKSQAGPSFGNNFNNRTEEALGSALCLWTAYREKAYLPSPQPFLGYLFMLEDCEQTNRPLRPLEPHFDVFPEFKLASYRQRYELFCRKLVLERHYTASAFITSAASTGAQGAYATPAEDLSVDRFVKILLGHLSPFV